MATKVVLVILLNLLLLISLPSRSLAKSSSHRKPGLSGQVTKNNHNNLDIIEASKEITDKIIEKLKEGRKSNESAKDQEALPQSSTGIYELFFAIGTPPQNVTSVMDISSGLLWTQCKTCEICLNQSTPLYNPNLSSTYSNFSSLSCNSTNFNDSSVCKIITPDLCPDGCEYTSTYDVAQNSTGITGTDNFTFGSSSVPDIFFGCGLNNYGDYGNSSGVFGLGRGPLSFVSQLQFMRFSYCLSSDSTKTSPLNFGSFAEIKGSGQSTPLVESDYNPDLYYIGLEGITVGTTLLNIPSSTFKLQPNGTGGVFLATTFPVTYLEQAGYNLVKQAFIFQMNQTTVNGSNLSLDLCFKSDVTWPSLILHFDGGASLKLKPINYLVIDPKAGIECLTILPSSGISALGSFIQMDTTFIYDTENSTISFEECDLSSSVVSSIPHLLTTMVLFFLCMLKFF